MFYIAGLLAALAGLFYVSGLNQIGDVGQQVCEYGSLFCEHPIYLLVAAVLMAAWSLVVSV